jgi:argonaute-like protein implicated in RNA metabolism and viral defense
MTPPHVIVVFIPARWEAWKRYDQEDETFDLHDFVKAYCVQKGIATQFIEEETLADRDVGRVIWFQALAIYAKAMRTPWILDCIDKDTAFIGIGYSHSASAPSGKHIVLGCSHIYSAEGIGLRYRLSQIEDPHYDNDDWRQRHPFMSIDDARRVG